MNIRIHRSGRPDNGGFSLIEILIAVVVLATGLLALTALQGRLAQASSEAKTRSRVAAMLASRMDELRAGQYDNAALAVDTGTGSTTNTYTCSSGSPAWLCTAQTESAISGLTVVQKVDRYTSAVGAGSFTVSGTAAANLSIPEFKRITLTATWNDPTGQQRRLAVSSDVSSLALTSNTIPNNTSSGSGGGKATVRQDSPETAGVIPIALGDGNSTAASNPKPELKGSNQNQVITATTFNVLTYVPGGSSAVIQKRFENEIVKCSCQYGAAGTGFSNLGAIYRKAEWPAVWTGDRYDVYDAGGADAPGTPYVSGPASGVVQSDLCTECCRDHHDTEASGVAKYDPERIAAGGGVSKYNASLVAVTNTTSGQYVDACRVIRVDGFWRVASDMYSRQMGLLETETVGGAKAKTGLPTSTAKTAYETFVKDYLDGYTGSSGTAPTGAQAMFDESARGLNSPSQVVITPPSNTDYRYLHSRGLYVDYLEADARTAVSSAISRCASGTPLADCILPKLPFTTINLTELAKWTASAPSVITVNSGSLLTNNPTQPSGGRTIGKVNGDSNNTAEVRVSNSGVGINTSLAFNGVDPSDNTTVQTDAQAFNVGGNVSTNPDGESFKVAQTGGGLDPSAFFTIGADVNVECLGAKASKVCDPNATASPWSGSIKLSRYWEITYANGTRNAVTTGSGNNAVTTVDGVVCTKSDSNGPTGALSVSVPIFNNYQVSTVSVTGAGTITSAVPAAADTSPGDNVQAETTTLAFTGLTSGSTINVGYSLQGSSLATDPNVTVAACTVKKSGNDWTLTVTSWNVPWD